MLHELTSSLALLIIALLGYEKQGLAVGGTCYKMK